MLIDTTYAARAPYSGTAVYIRKLVGHLASLPELEVVEAVDLRRRPPAGGGLGSLRNLVSDLRWTQVELPRRARQAHADVLHHPLPTLTGRASIPQVITVADLAFERLPACFDARFRLYAHFAHRAAARSAAAVICVSETTAADVRELWRVAGAKLVVARHGPGQEFPARARGPERGHLLYVGDQEPRKNLSTLIAAYARYRSESATPLPLVLAGRLTVVAPGVTVELSPSLERLAELYREAAALIQPSLYEGFGLTAAEAMAAGVPVIAARSPGLEEVCGEAALWSHPRDVAALAEAMAWIERDQELRGRLSDMGQRRARDFSWAGCARDHARAYSLAIGGR